MGGHRPTGPGPHRPTGPPRPPAPGAPTPWGVSRTTVGSEPLTPGEPITARLSTSTSTSLSVCHGRITYISLYRTSTGLRWHQYGFLLSGSGRTGRKPTRPNAGPTQQSPEQRALCSAETHFEQKASTLTTASGSFGNRGTDQMLCVTPRPPVGNMWGPQPSGDRHQGTSPRAPVACSPCSPTVINES